MAPSAQQHWQMLIALGTQPSAGAGLHLEEICPFGKRMGEGGGRGEGGARVLRAELAVKHAIILRRP